MTPFHYAVLGYTVGIVLLWGYALLMWNTSRTLGRRERARMEAGD